MCQICILKQIAAQDRWPKCVEASKADLNFLVDAVHHDITEWKAKAPSSPIPYVLLDELRLLAKQLDSLEAERQRWWTTPEKRAQRQRFEEECDQRKLSELHKINNTTASSIEAMEAKLGQFVKWTLGMNGGISELRHGDKVGK